MLKKIGIKNKGKINDPIEPLIVLFGLILVNFLPLNVLPKINPPTSEQIQIKSKYKKFNLDTNIGSFKSIIDSLKERSEEDERFKPNKIALDILKDEKLKELSSMNNWFIFRKIKQ